MVALTKCILIFVPIMIKIVFPKKSGQKTQFEKEKYNEECALFSLKFINLSTFQFVLYSNVIK